MSEWKKLLVANPSASDIASSPSSGKVLKVGSGGALEWSTDSGGSFTTSGTVASFIGTKVRSVINDNNAIGAEVSLYKNSTTPADNDVIGNIAFYANDWDSGESAVDQTEELQAKILSKQLDVDSGSSDSNLVFQTNINSTITDVLTLSDRVTFGKYAVFGSGTAIVGNNSLIERMSEYQGRQGLNHKIEMHATGDVSIRSNSTDDALYIKDNGRIGLNTSNPQELLHLYGTSGNQRLEIEATTGEPILKLTSGVKSWSWSVDPTHGNLRAYTYAGDSNVITMKSDGKIAIGHSTPTTVLDIQSGTNSTDINLRTQDDTVTSQYEGARVRFAKSGDGFLGHVGYRYYSATNRGVELYSSNDINFKVGGADTNSVTIKNTGLLGIGTDAPSYNLTIDNTGSDAVMSLVGSAVRLKKSAVDFLSYDGAYLDISSASALDLNTGGSQRLRIDSSGTATFAGIVDATNYKVSGAQGTDGQVLTSTGSGVAWEAIPASSTTFSSTINANEGISIPTTKILYFDGGDNTFIRENGADTLQIYTGGSKRLEIGSTGTFNFNTHHITNFNTLQSQGGLYLDNSGTLENRSASGNITFKTTVSQTVRMVIASGGNIGIAHDNPQELLDLSGGNIRLDNDQFIGWATTDGNQGRCIIRANESTDTMLFRVDNATRLTLTTSGLTVNDKGIKIGLGSSGSGGYMFHDFGTAYGFKGLTNSDYSSSAGSRMAMVVDNAELMTWHPTQKIGVGIDAPEENFHINSAGATTGLMISNSATDGDPYLVWRTTGSTAWAMGIDDGDSDVLAICQSNNLGSNRRVTITQAGEVGMGADPFESGATKSALTISNNIDLHVTLKAQNSAGNAFINFVNSGDSSSPNISNWQIGRGNSGAFSIANSDQNNLSGGVYRNDFVILQSGIANFASGSNVGINTYTPARLLEIKNATADNTDPQLRLQAGGTTSAYYDFGVPDVSGNRLRITSNASSDDGIVELYGIQTLNFKNKNFSIVGGDFADSVFQAGTSRGFVFQTNAGTNSLKHYSGGNTDILGNLDIGAIGNTNTQRQTDFTLFYGSASYTGNIFFNKNNHGNQFSITANETAFNIKTLKDDNIIIFSTQKSSTVTERLRIDGSGTKARVGINHTNPTYALDIINDGDNQFRVGRSASKFVRISDDVMAFTGMTGNGMRILTTDAGSLRLGTNNTADRITINSNGQVAINDSNPQDTLQVDHASGTGGNTLSVNANGVTGKGTLYVENRIGIGTATTPDQPLHIKVNSNNSDPYFFIENAHATGRSHARFWNSSRNTYWSFGQDSDNNFKIGNSVHFGTASTIKFMINNSDGRIGMGETSPTQKILTVKDSGAFGGTIHHVGASNKSSGTNTYSTWSTNDSSNAFQLTVSSSTNAYFKFQAIEQNVNYRDIVFNTDGGRVGVGITAPAYTFDCASTGDLGRFSATNGGGYPIFHLSNGAGSINSGTILQFNGGSASGQIKFNGINSTTSEFMILTETGGNLTEKMRIDENGLVGIGTGNNASHKLHVEGESVAYENGKIDAEDNSVMVIEYIAKQQTTNDTETELFLSGGLNSGRMVVPDDATWFFSVKVVARRVSGQREDAGYHFEGVIENDNGTTALVGSVQQVTLIEDQSAWSLVCEADDTNNSLKLKCRGENSKDINWVAHVRIVQTKG